MDVLHTRTRARKHIASNTNNWIQTKKCNNSYSKKYNNWYNISCFASRGSIKNDHPVLLHGGEGRGGRRVGKYSIQFRQFIWREVSKKAEYTSQTGRTPDPAWNGTTTSSTPTSPWAVSLRRSSVSAALTRRELNAGPGAKEKFNSNGPENEPTQFIYSLQVEVNWSTFQLKNGWIKVR